jgi:hypothetical protein
MLVTETEECGVVCVSGNWKPNKRRNQKTIGESMGIQAFFEKDNTKFVLFAVSFCPLHHLISKSIFQGQPNLTIL